MTNPVLTLREIAKLEKVHYQTVANWLREGRFGPREEVPKTEGGIYLIPREVYKEFSQQRRRANGKSLDSR